MSTVLDVSVSNAVPILSFIESGGTAAGLVVAALVVTYVLAHLVAHFHPKPEVREMAVRLISMHRFSRPHQSNQDDDGDAELRDGGRAQLWSRLPRRKRTPRQR
jgi:hypothetical protein